jgi:DNA modification methylase
MGYSGLICGDSDVLLQNMVDEGIKVDLILTDPPYNLNKDFGNDSDRLSLDDFIKVSRNRLTLCRDLLKPDGSIIWFGIHKNIGFIQTIMYDIGLNYRRMNICLASMELDIPQTQCLSSSSI